MSEWFCATIKEIAKVKGGKRLPAGSEFADGFTPFPYLRVTNMVNSTIKNEIVYVKPEIEPIIRNYKISKNDIYVTIAGTLGNFGNIPYKYDNAQLTENAAKITDINNAKYDKKYLVYIFNSDYVQNQIKKEIGIGGGVPKLALHRIERLKVKYPTLSRQRKIARILTTVDNIIEKTESAIEKYKAIKQGMMHDLFTRGIDVKTGKLRPCYEEAPQLYKETKLGMIPRDWDVVDLDKAADEKQYSFTGGPFGSDLQTKDYTMTGVRIIQLQNIGDGEFLNGYKIFTSANKANQLSSCNIFPGDIIISKMADPVARACIIPNYHNRYLMASDGIRLKLNSSFNAKFIMEQINHFGFRRRAIALSTGTTRERIGLTELRKIKIKAPKIEEQNQIGLRLGVIDKIITNEFEYLRKLHKQKIALMQDLLTGKKEVTPDSEDFDNEQ